MSPSAQPDAGTDRIQRLRTHAREAIARPEANPECLLAGSRSWMRTGNEPSHILRRGILAGDILRSLTPVIDRDELIVGKYSWRPLTAQEDAELQLFNTYGEPARSKDMGIRAHMAVDYERLLRMGIVGIREQIDAYRDPHGGGGRGS